MEALRRDIPAVNLVQCFGGAAVTVGALNHSSRLNPTKPLLGHDSGSHRKNKPVAAMWVPNSPGSIFPSSTISMVIFRYPAERCLAIQPAMQPAK